MANLQVKDAAAASKYLKATGAGSDVDPHIVEHEVTQATPDDLNVNANMQVGDVDVGAGNPVPVNDAGGSLTVDGTVTADAGTGPWPVTDNSGSLTVDQGTPDNLNCNANMQVGDSDVSTSNPVPVKPMPQTSGGLSIFRSIDLDESEEAVKASAGQLYGFYLYNAASSGKRYVKFYNGTVASVVVGTTTPVLTIPLDAGQGATVEFSNGIAFDTAITVAATTGVLDSDIGAPGANEVIANVFYK